MFRLYKSDEDGVPRAYYEVWAEPARRRIVEHWGVVGEPGETEVHRIWFFGGLETQIEKIMAPARAQGFEELPRGQYRTLIVRAVSKSSENISDEDEAFADRLNEVMGWTGLGECHEATAIESGLEAECDTVDAELCQRILAESLATDPAYENYELTFTAPEV